MVEIEMENYAEEGYVRDAEGNLIPDYDMTIKLFDDGDIVRGTIVQIDRDEVLVDIGYKSEGVIPINELSIRKGVNPGELVVIGDEIDALVLQKEDKDGRLILSKKRAEFERAWDRVETHNRDRQPIEGTVIEVVKGGLILDIGLRGFLPASLVDVRRVKDLVQYIGQKLDCLIIEMDRHRNNVVLSRRAVIDEERKHEREKILTNIRKGQVITGKVSSIVDFGAFVDLGGLDGLVHISELSWSHVDHPSEVLTLGQDVKVKVLDVDQERGRISLGYKQTQENPWKQKLGDLKVGDILPSKVIKIVPFGVFVELTDGVEALIHSSELQQKADKDVNVGDVIEARIADIDMDRRRISMALILPEGEVEAEAEEAVAEADVEAAAEPEENAAAKTEEKQDTVSEEASAVSEESTPFLESEGAKVEASEADTEEAVSEETPAPKKTQKTDKAGKAEDIKIKLVKKKVSGDAAEMIPPPEPGSLEEILQQMKHTPARTDES